jgi:hypothetical protein
MKKILLSILLYMSLWSLQAQDTTAIAKPVWGYAKIDFLNLFNPFDPSLLVSLEYMIKPERLSVTYELGSVVAIRHYKNVPVTGSFKSRLELRYYLTEFDKSEFITPYISMDLLYRKLKVDESYIVGYDCSDGCDYYRKYDGDFTTRRYAYQVKFGSQTRLGERIVVDLDMGIGASYLYLDRSKIDNGVMVETNRFLGEDAYGYKLFFTINGKLGYRIYK